MGGEVPQNQEFEIEPLGMGWLGVYMHCIRNWLAGGVHALHQESFCEP